MLKLVFVNGYRIFPPINGGHRRILDVYKSLAPHASIRFITLGSDSLDGGYLCIDANRTEVRVPKSLSHARVEVDSSVAAGTGVGQILLSDFADKSPAFIESIAQAVAEADVAIVGSPYVYPIVRALFNGPIVYHAHDVEALLQADLVSGSNDSRSLMTRVEQLERECVLDAALIVAMSDDDVNSFCERYGADPNRGLGLPPSVDLTRARTRLSRRALTGPAKVVFVGSHWLPNVIGVRALIGIAATVPEVEFVIVGGVADAFRGLVPPTNIQFTGFVDDATLADILAAADIAINPCQAYSGVNMKMTDYVLAGLPILSTASGARGLRFADGVHARIVPLQDFADALRLLMHDERTRERFAANALDVLRSNFDIEYNRLVLLKRLLLLPKKALKELVQT